MEYGLLAKESQTLFRPGATAMIVRAATGGAGATRRYRRQSPVLLLS